MSVLIKGLDMPDCCWNCPCIDGEYGECNISGQKIKGDGERFADCPLIELPDHGDLIDLISRQAAAKAVDWDTEAYTAIINLPTIDPVKHGKWELHEYPDGYYHTECSECGAVYDEKVYFEKTAHYCPNCGVKMDKKED